MDLLIAMVLGLFVGWLGSLVLRADSQGTVLACLAAGLAGSIIGPLLFGSDYLFDIMLVAALSAMIAVVIVHLACRAWSRFRPARG